MTAAEANDLATLASKYGSDKFLHGYPRWYAQHFAGLREDSMTILEIGVGGWRDPNAGGESLEMWRDYFANSQIIGVDSSEKTLDFGDRVTIMQGNAHDPAFVAELCDRYAPFDIVIDDGSHVNSQRNTTMELLLPHMSATGIFVLEGLHTSYLADFYGGAWPPPDTRRDSGASQPTTEVLKELTDGLNRGYVPGRAPARFDGHIVGVSFHPKIAFLQLGPNELTIVPSDQAAIDKQTETAQ